MTLYFAKSALLPNGWADDVLIETNSQGWITDVKTGTPDKGAQALKGPIIPGMPNVHSHAFQRAMAGLAERSNGGRDNFWSWREVMYAFLSELSPEDMNAIASQLYVEMLKSGYTSVGEFHYVHNKSDGTPYEDPLTLSRCFVRAAHKTGIGLTHIPTLYAYSNFGEKPPTHGQRRFITAPQDILRIIETLGRETANDPQIRMAVAHHSLRAASPEMIAELTRGAQAIDPTIPIHIHAAEQVKEVEDCLAWSGQRPVEWLLNNAAIGPNWCFIHATHMTDSETKALADSGAVAGLCPTTEGNLGDGIFNLPLYLSEGGAIGIGTDSHISINPAEELRWMEYVQRLTRRERSVACTDQSPHVGAFLYKRAVTGGAQALGRKTGALEIGCRADWIVLDDEHPLLYGKKGDLLLDSFIFSGNAPLVRDVFVGGTPVVENRRHKNEDAIEQAYKTCLDSLTAFKL